MIRVKVRISVRVRIRVRIKLEIVGAIYRTHVRICIIFQPEAINPDSYEPYTWTIVIDMIYQHSHTVIYFQRHYLLFKASTPNSIFVNKRFYLSITNLSVLNDKPVIPVIQNNSYFRVGESIKYFHNHVSNFHD